MLKTSKEWLNELEKVHEIKILDPDGWERRNYEYSFNEEEITKEDFKNRLMMSTIRANLGFFENEW